MASDSQNKQGNRADNVVSLSRHEFVMEIERKLAEARRFFSLRQYADSEKVVLQVLAADPNNSKAKALVDLLSIKLSRRKLYRSLADPEATSPPTSVPSPVEGAARKPGSAFSPVKSSTEAPSPDEFKTPKPVPRRRRSSISRPAEGSPDDTMRERTISAMVELLKENKSLERWRKPLSGELDSPSPAAMQTPAVGRQEPSVLDQSASPLPPSDFLPGSLDDLFTPASVGLAPPADLEHAGARPQQTPATASNLSSAKSLEAARLKAPPSREAEFARPAAVGPTAQTPEKLEDRRPVANLEVHGPALTEGNSRPEHPVDSPAPPPKVVHLPDIHLFEEISLPPQLDYRQEIDKRIRRRSAEVKNSEIKASSVAQIKKYLYQEQYELCAQELERIRVLFPQNAEIQAFVKNTSHRLAELQSIKAFESQSVELMASAVGLYQEGKLEAAMIAVREILRVNPHHVQAREFVHFVERRESKERRKEPMVELMRFCRACGTAVDDVSVYCFRCGKRLN